MENAYHCLLNMHAGRLSYDVRLSRQPFPTGKGHLIEFGLARNTLKAYLKEMFAVADELVNKGEAETRDICLIARADERSDAVIAWVLNKVFDDWNHAKKST